MHIAEISDPFTVPTMHIAKTLMLESAVTNPRPMFSTASTQMQTHGISNPSSKLHSTLMHMYSIITPV
jgi:hypothetical protein